MPDTPEAPRGADFLTEAEVAELLRIGRRTAERWRTTGDGPPWVRLGLRRVAYPRAAVLAWAEARTYPHRAAELAGKAAA
ncbi:helix-turn-helix domain-containing protein [Roseomonas sp. CAU 1739]|uniref:helix-turn-helix transcriptional regulator n=1 Tax=Roseomonas sp. CAU 1739 TaxID=3140364 RepID=UPI00325AE91E